MNIMDFVKIGLKNLADKKDKTIDEIVKEFEDYKEVIFAKAGDEILSDLVPGTPEFENRAFNFFKTWADNGKDNHETFKEAIFTGVDNINDINRWKANKVKESFKNAPNEIRAEMVANGEVITMVTTGPDGKPRNWPVADDDNFKWHKSDKGEFVLDSGNPLKMNAGESVIPRDNQKVMPWEAAVDDNGNEIITNRNYGFPIRSNPKIEIHGWLNTSSDPDEPNYVRFKTKREGWKYCNERDQEFAGRYPLFYPIKLTGAKYEDGSNEECWTINKDFTFELWDEERLADVGYTPEKYLGHVANLSKSVNVKWLIELADYHDKFQAKRKKDGTLVVKKSKNEKYGDTIDIDKRQVAFGRFTVKQIRKSDKGFYSMMLYDTSVEAASQKTFWARLRFYQDPRDFGVEEKHEIVACFQVTRSSKKYNPKTRASDEVGAGRGDVNIEILGMAPTSVANTVKEITSTPDIKKEEIQ